MSFSERSHGRRWWRAVFTGSLGIVGAFALGAGCQPVDSSEGEGDDEGDVTQAAEALGSPTCVTITDGVNGGVTEDAQLSGDYPSSPSGQYFGTWTGVSSGGNPNYSLLKFHLDGLPTGNNVVVTSATMSLYVSWNASYTTVRAHQALQPWDEATVTYSSYPSSSWSPGVAGSFNAGDVGTKQFDVTQLAQAWLGGQAANNGVVLEESLTASHYYFTREASSASQRPSLQVCYTVQNGPLPWRKVIGGADTQKVTSVAAGSDSSVVATGSFKGTLDLGGGAFTSSAAGDIFLVKYDAAGNHLWSKQFGSALGSRTSYGTAVAPDGSVYVTGQFDGNIDFGGGTLTSAGGGDIFLAKFDANGNHLWSKRYGSFGSDTSYTVSVGPTGDVYIGGILYIPHPLANIQLDFGGPLPSALFGTDQTTTAFVVHLTGNGDYVAQRFANTSGAQLVNDIAVDSLNRPTLAGHMEEGVGFCAFSSSGNASASDYNEARLSPGLGCQWGAIVGDPFSNDEGTAAAVGPQDVSVTGGTTGIIAPFGNIVDASFAGTHLRKHDAAGTLLWDKKYDGGQIRGLGVDSSGVIWATGPFFSTFNATGQTLTGGGGYVARFDASGNGLYQTSFGTSVSPSDLAIAPDNTAILAGSFTGTANFGGGSVTANGTDAYIVKMVP